jgi:integrase
MAHLERLVIVRHLDADGKRVPKGTPGARRKVIRSKKWYAVYRDVSGRRRRKPMSTNKAAAQTMLGELLKTVELERSGVVDAYALHRKTSIEKHLIAFEKAGRLKGHSERHVVESMARLRRVLITECKLVLLADVQASEVADVIGDMQREKGKGPLGIQSKNHYIATLKSFGNWLKRDKRLPENPFAHLEGGNAATDRRHDRQNLTAEQLGKILEAARTSGKEFRILTGIDRRMIYLVAIYTGFRRNELASLTPACFDLQADPPIAVLPVNATKNRRGAEQPLPAAIAAAIADYLRGRPAGELLWPGKWCKRASNMLRMDLEAAGVPYVVEGPDGPLYADLHSLRHSFIGLFEGAGISMKSAMALARHSDPKLTMKRYGKARLSDLGAAVEKLPIIGRPGPQEQRATGTDGGLVAPMVAQPRAGACGAERSGPGSDPKDANRRDIVPAAEKTRPAERSGTMRRYPGEGDRDTLFLTPRSCSPSPCRPSSS